MKHKFDSRGHYNAFTRWLESVDEALIALDGIMTDDIPTYDFFDAFQYGSGPFETAVHSLGDHIKQSNMIVNRSQS